MISLCMDCGAILKKKDYVEDGEESHGICGSCLKKRLPGKLYTITVVSPMGYEVVSETNSLLCAEAVCISFNKSGCFKAQFVKNLSARAWQNFISDV